MMKNIIDGCQNTVWKKVKTHNGEIWGLLYRDSFLKSFPLIRNFESFDGVIAWFVVLEDNDKRHLLLLPEKMIGNKDYNDLQWYYRKPIYDNDGNLDIKGKIPSDLFRNNTFKSLQYAIFNLGSLSPKDMFNNFFREANISSANLSGSYPLYHGSNWFSSSKITENYPCVYDNNIFKMIDWNEKIMNKVILSSSYDINFYKQEELPENICVPTEWHTLIKNTGRLKAIDMEKNPFISSENIKNYWCREIDRCDLNTLRIIKSPLLEYLKINLLKNATLEISGAESLEDIDVVDTIYELRCERVMRSMLPDEENYNFIKNLSKKEKPLAKYVSIKMGYFFYTGMWEGLHEYIKDFFDWLKHRKYREINDNIILLE